MDTHQETILLRYKKLSQKDWLIDPIKWEDIQWHFWGTLFTDMSIGYGEYFSSFASNLKDYLRKESLYLICGNKDDIILLLLYLCKNKILPTTKENYHIFRIKGNKYFEKVKNLNLSECSFEGTRESELHFKIFYPLSKEFINLLFKSNLLVDLHKDNKSFFKIFQKRLPYKLIINLENKQRNALLSGMIDGDGSAGIMITCPKCSKRNTIRSDKFICEKCSFDLSEIVRSMDYNIMLDSTHFERLKEELEFLVKIMGLKGHLYALYVQKDKPDKLSKEKFNERLKIMDKRMEQYKQLADELRIPIVIRKHILREKLPSYKYAPDVYGSIKFLFTPHFRSKKEKIKWFGTDDIHSINLKIIKNSLDYMFIMKKRSVLSKVIRNKNL